MTVGRDLFLEVPLKLFDRFLNNKVEGDGGLRREERTVIHHGLIHSLVFAFCLMNIKQFFNDFLI